MCADAEFAISLDPNNSEMRKQYSEIKALHMEVKKLCLKIPHHTP
jgi:RNA polymerase II-associated protein 3